MTAYSTASATVAPSESRRAWARFRASLRKFMQSRLNRFSLYLTAALFLLALFAPLIVLAAVVFIPVLDLLMAVVRRTRAGRSPFAPDKMPATVIIAAIAR